jgi:hypothetical protein
MNFFYTSRRLVALTIFTMISYASFAEGNRSLLKELHLKKGQQYSDAKAQLVSEGWKVDSSNVDESSPNPKTPYGFGEVACGNGRMAVCNARFLRGDREIMLTLQPKNNLLVDGAWDDK